MVLCRDEAAMRGGVYARLVVTTVTISEYGEGRGKEGGGRRGKVENGRESWNRCDYIHVHAYHQNLIKKDYQTAKCTSRAHDNNDVIMTSDDAIIAHFILKVRAPMALESSW